VGVQEAADYLRINSSKLYLMLKRHEIPGAFRVGGVRGSWRIDFEELQRFFSAKNET
jgi:excisionase family DNA binding protein